MLQTTIVAGEEAVPLGVGQERALVPLQVGAGTVEARREKMIITGLADWEVEVGLEVRLQREQEAQEVELEE